MTILLKPEACSVWGDAELLNFLTDCRSFGSRSADIEGGHVDPFGNPAPLVRFTSPTPVGEVNHFRSKPGEMPILEETPTEGDPP